MNLQYFGTDGIRGRVGEPPITADFILKLGWAAGSVLSGGERRAVVIGKDTRVSGYLFESALEAGLSAAGVDVLLLGPMPTPAVAHLTRSLGAVAGIVISASHNPFEDNGIKFFSADGQKLPDEIQSAIEAKLGEDFAQVEPGRLGKASRVDDAAGRFVEFCKGTVTYGTRFDRLKLVVDTANGATYRIAPDVFRELGAHVIAIHNEPDGFNINAECGSTDPRSMADTVMREQADLGVAFDGDGDRVILADHTGRIVDGDQMLYILARHRAECGEIGGVVGTVMSNFGLEEALGELGIPFERAPVGDRFVHERLLQLRWVLGGEASGHILCLDRSVTGCGIVAALQVIEVIAVTGQSLAELASGMRKYPQTMINVPVNGNAQAMLDSDPGVQKVLGEAEAALDGAGRIILRPSGTEPVVRVTVEGRDAKQVEELARKLAEAVRAGEAAQ